MYELRTLGAVGWTGVEATTADVLLSQPKRLAVLVHLVMGSASGGRSREAVAALFWPDADESHARASLRGALHFLRTHLGSGVIVSRGDHLHVDTGRLRCDANVFDEAVVDGRLEEALASYGGDLLPGTAIDGAPGAEVWLENERSRLRRLAARAAWALAQKQEELGNRVTAADLARRATSLEHYGEQAGRRLMRLLERVGDRVAALRAFDELTARWARSYGVEPSPQTRALAQSIRATLAAPELAPASSRSTPDRPVGTIAVLPFLASGGGTAEQEALAGGLAHEVISSLARMSGVRVVARGSIDRYHRRRGRSVPGVVSDLGADTVLDGAVRIVGDTILLVAKLFEARTSRPLWAGVYEGEPDEVLSLRSGLVIDLLDALGIDATRDEVADLARRPTTDPEAYRLYLEGRARLSRRTRDDTEAALACFQRALEADPAFALAQAAVADASLVRFPAAGVRAAEARVQAGQAARAALALDPRLGEAHATLGLLRAVLDADWDGAEEEFLVGIELSPGHATAHHWYGSYLAFARRRFDEAQRELEVAQQLDPLSPIVRADLGLALLNRGRRQEALLTLREVLDVEPDFWRAHYDLGVTSILCGDPESGTDHLERAWALGAFGHRPEEGARHGGPAASWRERLGRAVDLMAASDGRRGPGVFEMALLSALLGREKEALRWLKDARERPGWAFVLQYLPAFEPVRDHPEFVGMVREAGLEHVLEDVAWPRT